MVLGLTLEQFTLLHVVISMIAIFAGFVVVGGLFSNAGLGGWTAFFLALTVLTNVTGFLFPIGELTPALVLGTISSLLLLVACAALYGFRLAGRWRLVYVITAMLGLYFNVFVMIVQSFQKVSFLTPLAPTGTETPFFITQAVTVAGFLLLGFMAARAFQPHPKIVT
jgi:hypothetical protein